MKGIFLNSSSTFQCIALIGYRATGKTSVGRVLADELGWTLVDTDAQIQRMAGKSIAAIFADDGEAVFRKLEIEAIQQNVLQPRCVLSLGGGAVMQEANRQAMEPAFTVWLTASPTTIHERLLADVATADQRPNLTSQGRLEEVQSMLSLRTPTYAACSDVEVNTEDKTVTEIVAEIVPLLPLSLIES